MKWLMGIMVALLMVSGAMAGEDPYIGIVGNDALEVNTFYFSPKYLQFLYDQESLEFSIPVCESTYGFIIPAYRNYLRGCEQFRSQTPVNQPEICDTTGVVFPGGSQFSGLTNARTTAFNSGSYQWYIRLPKKPNGELNLVFQCGVLKPNAFAIYNFAAVDLCAAETGERVGPNCSRIEVNPGENPIIPTALPTVTAIAYPGAYANPDFPLAGFNLTAWRNPGTYGPDDGTLPNPLIDNDFNQVLNGAPGTRILLKSCFDKTVIVKLPVTGQQNALGQTEYDLEAGDIVYVRLNIPRAGTTDIYCHPQSLRLMGIGEAP